MSTTHLDPSFDELYQSYEDFMAPSVPPEPASVHSKERLCSEVDGLQAGINYVERAEKLGKVLFGKTSPHDDLSNARNGIEPQRKSSARDSEFTSNIEQDENFTFPPFDQSSYEPDTHGDYSNNPNYFSSIDSQFILSFQNDSGTPYVPPNTAFHYWGTYSVPGCNEIPVWTNGAELLTISSANTRSPKIDLEHPERLISKSTRLAADYEHVMQYGPRQFERVDIYKRVKGNWDTLPDLGFVIDMVGGGFMLTDSWFTVKRIEISRGEPKGCQWTTLKQLHTSSKLQYVKFLKHSRRIKKLRPQLEHLYTGSKGILDLGISTFRDVLDGNEPCTLKEVFAFTCLYHVISDLLEQKGEKHHSMSLDGSILWRTAIKNEHDRLLYDKILLIMWPDSRNDETVQGDALRIYPSNEIGMHDSLIPLLEMTESNEDFKFSDFLTLDDTNTEKDMEMTGDSPLLNQIRSDLQVPSQNGVLGQDPVPSKLSSQTEFIWRPPDEVLPIPSMVEYLIGTIMFQIILRFIIILISPDNLLFNLSGCGITTRYENRHGISSVQEFGDFVTTILDLIITPIGETLGKSNDSVDAVLCMTEGFVRSGRLRTVRDVEEYIITTAHCIVQDYNSFTQLVSETLKHCLDTSSRLTWDFVYPNLPDEQRNYSAAYINEVEVTETLWALRNHLEKDCATDTVENSDLKQPEQVISPSSSDSTPSKKPKVSTPSSNSDTVTPASTVSESCSNFHKAHCPHTNCGKSYTGRDSRVNLRRHIRTFHEGGKMTKCPKCEHQSPRRDNIRKHFLSRHKGDELPSVLRCRTRA